LEEEIPLVTPGTITEMSREESGYVSSKTMSNRDHRGESLKKRGKKTGKEEVEGRFHDLAASGEYDTRFTGKKKKERKKRPGVH